MQELINIKSKADLWWRERRGILQGLFKNPLFLILGVRISQPDTQTVQLHLPWNKTQRILTSEIPLAVVIGAAEMALQVHLRQFQVFAPSTATILGAELELPRPLDESVEIRLKATWPEWEELRLRLAQQQNVEREYVLPLWNQNGRTIGSVTLRACLQAGRFLP